MDPGRTVRDAARPALAADGDHADGLRPFRPAVLAIRWSTLGLAVAFAIGDPDERLLQLAWGLALFAIAVWRTVRPLRTDEPWAAWLLAGEAAVATAATATTGAWSSPYAFALIAPVVVASMGGGFVPGIAHAAAVSAAAGAVDLAVEQTPARTSVQWIAELLLVAVAAGYARHILGEQEREHTQAMSRIDQLADANALLYSLHRVTQALPASLDLDEALDSAMGQLRDLFDADAAAILLLDDTDGCWVPARRDGVRPPDRMATGELPRPLRRALDERRPVLEPNLLATGGPGLAPRLSSGLYAALTARGSTIGLVAVEHADAEHYGERDVELLGGFVEPVALALDNARWFGRLRTVGAEEERSRIARDLHDRIGQSLAYLAFELDRIVKADERGDDVGPALERLREDVRTVVRQVRDTLYDLRTDVSEDQGFVATLELFAERLRERSGLDVVIRADEDERLPLPRERELFRIAQEAMVNAERHASASRVTVTWQSTAEGALLEIADDGVGFPVGRAGRLDSYGLLGMRERAASIGATLTIDSAPGRGTRIVCELAP